MSFALALLVPAWLMSLFYLPGFPPLLFLTVALCLAFRPEVFEKRRLASAIAGAGAGIALTLVYFGPVLRAYADSEYPGGRWTEGGAMPVWQVASQFLPASTTEIYEFFVAANLPEATTVSSWLPILAVCLVDHRFVRWRYGSDSALRRDLRRIATLVLMWIVITLWQILPLVPLSYVFGFGFSPEARTLFASGALLLIAAAYAIDRLPLRVTRLRLAVFAVVVSAPGSLHRFNSSRRPGLHHATSS